MHSRRYLCWVQNSEGLNNNSKYLVCGHNYNADEQRKPDNGDRGISHDPAVYKDPSFVKPERFLGDTPDIDPYSMAFGFGRRCGCPTINVDCRTK